MVPVDSSGVNTDACMQEMTAAQLTRIATAAAAARRCHLGRSWLVLRSLRARRAVMSPPASLAGKIPLQWSQKKRQPLRPAPLQSQPLVVAQCRTLDLGSTSGPSRGSYGEIGEVRLHQPAKEQPFELH